jgi:hypothetical protein
MSESESGESQSDMFVDEKGQRTIGFCLWCGTDFYSLGQFESHNANELATCPVFQALKGMECMPPVLQLMLKEPGLPGEHAQNDSDENTHVPTKKLELGRVVATPGALAAMEESGDVAWTFLARHLAGDWGNLSEEDRKENEFSQEHGFRLLSSYKLRNGIVIWVITEADRSSTCLLLPDEY